jgi:DNA helicase HerA-like ATPase
LNKILTRHVSVVARTGSGKSYAVGVLAEEILQPSIQVEVELVVNADIVEAIAEAINPFSVIGDDVREIDFNVGESLMAYAEMTEAIVAITIPFRTMYASAKAVNSTPYFDPYHLLIVQQSRLPLSTSFAGRWGIGDID